MKPDEVLMYIVFPPIEKNPPPNKREYAPLPKKIERKKEGTKKSPQKRTPIAPQEKS